MDGDYPWPPKINGVNQWGQIKLIFQFILTPLIFLTMINRTRVTRIFIRVPLFFMLSSYHDFFSIPNAQQQDGACCRVRNGCCNLIQASQKR